ncbi:MAG: hypothetical protein JWN34_5402 [Bryobacterales bacterium]|nr:hypothetical protein [Bryobacterales bacterium]
MSRQVAVAVAALLTAGSTFAATPNGPKPQLDPSQGDGGVSRFYVWDKEVPGRPGQLLRQEPLPVNLMLANSSKGLRVLYTSTNGIDDRTPITVSGAVYFPKGPLPAGGWPVVAWGHGTVGIADVCAPSWAPRTQRDTDYLNAWLAQGFAIAATDYQGLGTPGVHPAGIVKSEAYGVLDSARSAIAEFRQLSNSVIIVGQSQGARAGVSAALLAHQYAPDLKIKGTVATGVPGGPPYAGATKAPQIPVPESAGGGANARLAVLRLLRLRAVDPAFDLTGYLSDAAKPVVDAALTGCSAAMEQAASRTHLTAENVFRKVPLSAVENAAPYQRYPNPPRFAQPLFVGTGLSDVTAFPEGQYNFVMAACYEGSTVEAHYYSGLDHSGAVNASLVDSIPFVRKVLAGQHVTGNCKSVKPPSSGE